jgi:polyketide synthase PksN
LAVAGGVNVLIDPQGFLTLKEAGILSSTGEVRLFDNSGDGYLRGEGVGALLLKSLSKAVEDGDHIYAVIRGSDMNHDGKSFSLTSPNPVAQKDVEKNAYARSGIDPRTVSYIEAQGTGSPMGDPVEINAFRNAFEELCEEQRIEPEKGYCGIGYLKPSIGHLESAYGISAILKVVLAMEKGMIPATRNLNVAEAESLMKNLLFILLRKTGYGSA